MSHTCGHFSIRMFARTRDASQSISSEVDSSTARQKYKTSTKKKRLTAFGNCKARVGPDLWIDFGFGFTATTRTWDLGFPKFARSHRLTSANTLHPHKKSRAEAWCSLDGLVLNRIDLILCLDDPNPRPRRGHIP